MRYLQLWLVGLALATSALPVRAQDHLNVVASFSIIGDFVRNVGGDRVSVTTLVGPNGDVHVYTPAPADAKKIADAKLLVVNGLGLEGWLPRLVQSSGGKAGSLATRNGEPWGSRRQSPCLKSTGSPAPSTASQHAPEVTA